jgi:hypothetical protein
LGTCNAKKLSRSDGGENEVRRWELRDFVIDFDAAAKTLQMTNEDICESLGAAPQNRPTARVTGSHESQTNGGRSWSL